MSLGSIIAITISIFAAIIFAIYYSTKTNNK